MLFRRDDIAWERLRWRRFLTVRHKRGQTKQLMRTDGGGLCLYGIDGATFKIPDTDKNRIGAD
ncbi:MAG: hypothetical protein JXR76_12745 [Deltaproteobacteria bacterium]|nr:hypothetical protein [Deltaproteobacteria bacterium]